MNCKEVYDNYSNNICKVINKSSTENSYTLTFDSAPKYKVSLFDNGICNIIYVKSFESALEIVHKFDGYCLIHDLLPITDDNHKCYEYYFGNIILYDVLPNESVVEASVRQFHRYV